jgi:CBS domain-containing protein
MSVKPGGRQPGTLPGMKVDSILTPEVVRIERSATLESAARLMRERHVGALLVTEDSPHRDRFAGIVTDRDIVLKGVAENLAARVSTVAEVMTPATASIELGAELTEALAVMRSRGVRRVLVMRADGGLAGLVSLDDIVDALGDQLAGLSGILRSELEREMARSWTG